MSCELSIIVPVYNAALYLERTVGQLLTQIVEEYEIILVDDGSTDESPAICDELANEIHNIRCVHCENGGPGRARNRGIHAAHGEYIAFCDSDDMPSPNMYGTLLSDLKRYDVDHSICDIYSERDGSNLGFPWSGDRRLSGSGEISRTLIAAMLGNLSDNDVTRPVWGSCVRGIYRRDLLLSRNILFPEDISFAEDLVFNIRYLKEIDACFIRDEALYRYTYHPDSLMNRYSSYIENCFSERLKLVEKICDEIAALPDGEMLSQRFRTSQRCYFVECVGNAARAIKAHGYSHALKEIRSIVNNSLVCSAFEDFDAQSLKRGMSYQLIKGKHSLWLLLYYALRLR